MEDVHISSSEHNGLQLHLCSTNKFKTISIMLMIKVPLQEDLTTARALIPHILNSGTINYPNRKLIKEKLGEMYGATLSADVQKKGDHQIIMFRMEIPADQFLSIPHSLLKLSLDLLHEVVYNPLLENGKFNSSIVEQEKRSLKQRLSSMYDEKILYANVRLIEEMFKGEAYQFPASGREEDIVSLDALSITKYIKICLKTVSLIYSSLVPLTRMKLNQWYRIFFLNNIITILLRKSLQSEKLEILLR